MTTTIASPEVTVDWENIRADFPILRQKVHGKPLAYLDNAATSQKPNSVIQALSDYYSGYNSNVHRGIHHLAERATETYEDSRRRLADWIGAGPDWSVVFTRGTTESINLVASVLTSQFQSGDEILLTVMEHHSNLVPWQLLSERTGAVLRFLHIDEHGQLDPEEFRTALERGPKLVAFSHESNVLGTVNPAETMTAAAREAGAMVLIDAAQSAPHGPLNIETLDPDFLVFSGHKMCGPTGIGVLVARQERMNDLPPYMGGGEMIQKVTLEKSTYAESPARFEAGTPHIAGAVGLLAAVEYLEQIGMESIHDRVRALTSQAVQALQELDGITLYGPKDDSRMGAVSFSVEGVHPHDLSHYLDQQGVAVRAGHMCCQPLLEILGHSALNRASFSFYNNDEDLDQLIAAIRKGQAFFKHVG